MISSSVFDYVNVMNKALDASWLRNETIANNIANQSTPGYKREDVDFEGALKQALQASGYRPRQFFLQNRRQQRRSGYGVC